METNAAAAAMTNADPEIRREKVSVPPDLSLKEIMEKFNVSKTCAWNAKKKGWLMLNYSRNQIIIDREHF
jgi:hypothetical protein